MIFNPKYSASKKSMYDTIDMMIEKGCYIEVSEWIPKRTINQNKFIHVCLGFFGSLLGYTLEEAKTIVKRSLNFYYEKKGHKFLRSTASMDKEEASKFIKDFRRHAVELGVELPDAELYKSNPEYQRQVENQIKANMKGLMGLYE